MNRKSSATRRNSPAIKRARSSSAKSEPSSSTKNLTTTLVSTTNSGYGLCSLISHLSDYRHAVAPAAVAASRGPPRGANVFEQLNPLTLAHPLTCCMLKPSHRLRIQRAPTLRRSLTQLVHKRFWDLPDSQTWHRFS